METWPEARSRWAEDADGDDLFEPCEHSGAGITGPVERPGLGEVFEDALVDDLGVETRREIVE